MKKHLLGDRLPTRKFHDFSSLLKKFTTAASKKLVDRKRSEEVNQELLSWIQKQPTPSFLLPDILSFIQQVEEKKILHHYTFTSFELWLNHFSSLSFEDNLQVRAKIVGKRVDRSDYQILFPIGMGKVYEGTHFVTAHKSPDLDTTIASFWGWIDAFAARVGNGLHIWNLPGGPPPSQIEIEWLFRNYFGEAVFTHLAKTKTALSLTGNDLMTQKGLLLKRLGDSITAIDHERDQNAVIVVDDEGFYLGDWRSLDVEGVRQVIILLSSCLRWFENNLHLQLIALLARPELIFKEIHPFLKQLFELTLEYCEPAQEFTRKQKKQVDAFLIQVLSLKQGLSATFEQLGLALARLVAIPFQGVEELVQAMKSLFDRKGKLQENRPQIFEFLEKAVRGLHEVIFQIRSRLEKLDMALKTKHDVFGHHPHYVTVRAEVEEIQEKIGSHLSLTVVYPDHGKHYPVGVILASDLRKNTLGTVSLRDFCNRDEMTIPPYLEVISVIDHHKSTLNTYTPPLAIIADAQSSNSLVARAAFEINDRLKRLLSLQKNTPFFLHPEREYLEYLHFLYGIIDDTDLLSKVSALDLECIVSLLNRLKSLASGKPTTLLSLDDLPRDATYLKQASRRILQHEEMYSLYRKVYAFREKEVENNISLTANYHPSNFFADTKEQNGCCSVGQTKIFARNIAHLHKHLNAIRHVWLERAKKIHHHKKEIDLHIHMISTIVSAEEVYRGKEDNHPHQDELWIWIPSNESAIAHLKRFLSSFQSLPVFKNDPLEVEFLGDNGSELSQIFKESFLDIPHQTLKRGLPIAILKFRSGALNSRKAMVSPFLPTL